MKVFKSYEEVTKFVKSNKCQLENAMIYYTGLDEFALKITNIMDVDDKEVNYVYFNVDDDTDCKKFFMKFIKDLYVWKVYINDVEGWQKCNIVDVSNTGLDINGATVMTNSGIKLDLCIKYFLYQEDRGFLDYLLSKDNSIINNVLMRIKNTAAKKVLMIEIDGLQMESNDLTDCIYNTLKNKHKIKESDDIVMHIDFKNKCIYCFNGDTAIDCLSISKNGNLESVL